MSIAPDDPRHGTTNGYTNLRCRCDACRKAWADYFREKNHRTGRTRPIAEHHAAIRAAAEGRDNHGTERRYKFGCRCDECMRGAAKARERRRRHANPAVHGSNTSYSNGCRCDDCRAAHTVYSRERKRAQRAAA